MARVIIVYGTVEGHTRKVAAHIQARLTASGHSAVHVSASSLITGFQEEAEYDGVLVCAPVHQGKHPEVISRFVQEHRDALASVPSAFISVSLSAALPGREYREEAESYIQRFIQETGWQPAATLSIAGALLYTQYDYLSRLLMRMISERRGGDTDTSRDYIYTDWGELDRFVDRFVARAVRPPEKVSL